MAHLVPAKNTFNVSDTHAELSFLVMNGILSSGTQYLSGSRMRTCFAPHPLRRSGRNCAAQARPWRRRGFCATASGTSVRCARQGGH